MEHGQAVENVREFLKEHKVENMAEWYIKFNPKFNMKNKLREDYGHSYDIVLTKQITNQEFKIDQIFLFLEIDGEKHSKKNQKINDGIAEKYVQEFLNNNIIRLDKRECLGEKEDRNIYLMRMLWKYIK